LRDKYYPPKYNTGQFHCVYCGVFAAQQWFSVNISENYTTDTRILACQCSHCYHWSYWYEEKLVIPSDASVEPPHPDLPEDCAVDYREARDIFTASPRAAAALLRLSIQKLMSHLGEKGSNINDDIKSLVSKGLPVAVQQSLDYCRVVGNNAVHPGEIDIKDSPEVAQHLFAMINFIVEDRISRPNEIKALYLTLPEPARKAIEKRDGKAAEAGSEPA
jgi:hypothetical protein